MPNPDEVAELVTANGYLAIVSTVRADGTIQASLVSAGVTTHPLTGREVLGFVAVGDVKVVNVRARPKATATFHHGWKWITFEGSTELVILRRCGAGAHRPKFTSAAKASCCLSGDNLFDQNRSRTTT